MEVAVFRMQKKMSMHVGFFGALFFLFCGNVFSQETTYSVAAKSQIRPTIYLKNNTRLEYLSKNINGGNIIIKTKSDKSFSVKNGKFEIPVSSVKSKLVFANPPFQAALRSDEYPLTIFVIDEIAESNGQYAANGFLTLADTRRPISVPVTLEFGKNFLKVDGVLNALLSDFNIVVPRIFGGAVKMRGDFSVDFSIVLEN